MIIISVIITVIIIVIIIIIIAIIAIIIIIINLPCVLAATLGRPPKALLRAPPSACTPGRPYTLVVSNNKAMNVRYCMCFWHYDCYAQAMLATLSVVIV